MAIHPPNGPALTIAQRADVARFEAVIDTAVYQMGVGGPYRTIPLDESPSHEVADELRRRYLSAGWSRVLIGRSAAGPYVELQALADVHLARRPA